MKHTTSFPIRRSTISLCLLTFFYFLNIQLVTAQNVAINTDGSKADPSAIVDIKSSTKGLLIPRMTTASRLLIPQTNGLLVYDINTKSFWYSNGEAWQNMAETTAAGDAWLLNGNVGTVDNVNFIGTTDASPLNFRVNNVSSGRIDPLFGNTYFGFGAGLNSGFNTNGWNNTGFGKGALITNTTGYNNIAVGADALAYNTSGFHNAAVGRMSLLNNSTGFNNTAMGTSSLFSNTTGKNNTSNGAAALYNNTTGSENIAIGSQSLFSSVESDANLAIGNNALYSLISGNGNVAVGNGSLYSFTRGFDNTALGFESLYSSTSTSSNTAVGVRSLYSNTYGSGNTAVGSFTLSRNISGGRNTVVGGFAMNSNTLGTANVALGWGSLSFNTYGTANTATGHGSMSANTSGNANTVTGAFALVSNTTGNNNTIMGYEASVFNSTGNGNVAIGNKSLDINSIGSFNTAIGTEAGVTSNNLQNATALGYQAKVEASNKVRIGNAAVTVIEGQVPFTTPSDGRYKFQVKEDVKGLDFILALRPVTYQFDVNRFDNRNASTKEQNLIIQTAYDEAASIRRTGFIAQEVEAAAKKSGYNFSGVIKPKTPEDHYGLSYESFVVPLVKAIQEQQELINAQNIKITELQQQNKRMEEQDKKINLLILEIEQLKKKFSH